MYAVVGHVLGALMLLIILGLVYVVWVAPRFNGKKTTLGKD